MLQQGGIVNVGKVSWLGQTLLRFILKAFHHLNKTEAPFVLVL